MVFGLDADFCEVQGNQTGTHRWDLRSSSSDSGQNIESLPLNGRQKQLTHVLSDPYGPEPILGTLPVPCPTPTHCQLGGSPSSHWLRVLLKGQHSVSPLPPGIQVHLYTCSRAGGPGPPSTTLCLHPGGFLLWILCLPARGTASMGSIWFPSEHSRTGPMLFSSSLFGRGSDCV